jgi:hypothetical protein
MNNDIKEKICQDDFYLMMRNAVLQAGGADNLEKWKNMTLVQLVNILAQNGIRMVYMSEKHMNCVNVIWKTPDVEYSISSPTTRKQLAEDMYDGKYDKLPEFN